MMYARKAIALQVLTITCALCAKIYRDSPAPADAEYYELYAAYDDVRSSEEQRSGQATDTHTCAQVRSVPEDVRSQLQIPAFYQKYTEAYGIPIITSSKVPDAALQRACYTARFLLADWYSIRNGYYKRNGRFALIAKSEKIRSIPEYSYLPKYWDTRARGLGGTVWNPISTGAEENALCEGWGVDNWHSQDIVLHEYAHGMHLLGAKHEIENFQIRLLKAYQFSKSTGLWNNTYAMSTVNEYYAEGVGSYFDQNYDTWNGKPNGVKNHVDTRAELKEYDPTLYELIDEMFPCRNEYIDRCDDKTQEKSLSQKLKINAPECKLEEEGEEVEEDGPSCVDKSKKCALWAEQGRCKRKKVKAKCMKSCQEC